jgi:hypothetical protein
MGRLDVEAIHWTNMKRIVRDLEKDWKEGAFVSVKNGMEDLKRSIREVEKVIMAQLYKNLGSKGNEETNNGQQDSERRGFTSAP